MNPYIAVVWTDRVRPDTGGLKLESKSPLGGGWLAFVAEDQEGAIRKAGKFLSEHRASPMDKKAYRVLVGQLNGEVLMPNIKIPAIHAVNELDWETDDAGNVIYIGSDPPDPVPA